MTHVFSPQFWLSQWEQAKQEDTYQVHKGFASVEYWDKVSAGYDKDKKELGVQKLEKTMAFFRRKHLVFPGMKVLDIGCGTGRLATAFAGQGAHVVALDFSEGMLDRFRQELPKSLESNVDIRLEDWKTLDVRSLGWEKHFDLVIAFMSPAVSTPDSFFKMMSLSKNACAMRGWSAKRKHAILDVLWDKIMKQPLDDNPQSILYKINLLFSMNLFPDIVFDTIEWEQSVSLEEEMESQMAFFSKVSDMPEKELKDMILTYLETIVKDHKIVRTHKGSTLTAIWNV